MAAQTGSVCSGVRPTHISAPKPIEEADGVEKWNSRDPSGCRLRGHRDESRSLSKSCHSRNIADAVSLGHRSEWNSFFSTGLRPTRSQLHHRRISVEGHG